MFEFKGTPIMMSYKESLANTNKKGKTSICLEYNGSAADDLIAKYGENFEEKAPTVETEVNLIIGGEVGEYYCIVGTDDKMYKLILRAVQFIIEFSEANLPRKTILRQVITLAAENKLVLRAVTWG